MTTRAARPAATSSARTARPRGITALSVAGYKSVNDELTVVIRPLTVLAGPNSSGKSSVMQPLLLLKQTLDATYDPGPLRLDGPNVRFTEARQLFHRVNKSETLDKFHVRVSFNDTGVLSTFFELTKEGLTVTATEFAAGSEVFALRPNMNQSDLRKLIPKEFRTLYDSFAKRDEAWEGWAVVRDRCFLEVRFTRRLSDVGFSFIEPGLTPWAQMTPHIRDVIHVPGLRGNPLRTYPVNAIGPDFPGTFERYVASIISHWQQSGNTAALRGLGKDLQALGLTWKVFVRPITDTEVELQVGRLAKAAQGGAWDLVSIADVGFGVSQTLPVLVALRAARPGQIVYLEQPEIHLHPRAQHAMATVIAAAAKRGVRVVVETHSSLLLVSLQTLVARGKLPRDEVILHWFTRSPAGDTQVTSAELDDDGSFGDWPEDFGDVILEAEASYLDASSD